MSQEIVVERVSKSFGSVRALEDVNVAFRAGSFTTLLGPSGCGKTTLLRLIAGFEELDEGAIRFGETTVARPGAMLPPEQRNVGVVFQSYALWPHMSVGENVGYPLKLRGRHGAARARAVADALDMVGLSGLEARRTEELSGGQRQRVALARCLVADTPLILFDEPLANLDMHLRAHMVDIFRDIHRRVGATIVYVTHDQSEALALSDRVCVMDHGRLVQEGTPQDVYHSPATLHVAGFVGRGSIVSATAEAGRTMIGGWPVPARGGAHGASARVLLRPEAIAVAERGLEAVVASTIYRGSHHEVRATLAASGEPVQFDHYEPLAPGRRVALSVRDAWIVPGG